MKRVPSRVPLTFPLVLRRSYVKNPDSFPATAANRELFPSLSLGPPSPASGMGTCLILAFGLENDSRVDG